VRDPGTIQSPAYPDGLLPPNVIVGENSRITGGKAFVRFFATLEQALVIGNHCTLDGVSFAMGENGKLVIGNHCYFTGVVLLVEREVVIGNRVWLGWNVTVGDTDFHPTDPASRIDDAIACSNISDGRPRPPIVTRAVVIEDDVWMGPGATVLKGVRIGAGSFIEPGSLVTKDIPPRSRVMGNPARVIGEV
jgi:acetyltransferase-like isoleucine patch superfamily enzyme